MTPTDSRPCAACESAAKQRAKVPVLPGDMPDAMWEAIRSDRDYCTEAMRIAVRQTLDEYEFAILSSCTHAPATGGTPRTNAELRPDVAGRLWALVSKSTNITDDSQRRAFAGYCDEISQLERALSARQQGVCVPRELWQRLIDVHRGWCNYCCADESTCLLAPNGGCVLRDCILAAAPSADQPNDAPGSAIYGPTKQSPDGTLYRLGTATGATVEDQPNAATQGEKLGEPRELLGAAPVVTAPLSREEIKHFRDTGQMPNDSSGKPAKKFRRKLCDMALAYLERRGG